MKADPGRTAIVHGQSALSWARLEARADGIAARLRDVGVGVSQIVGVAIPRGLDWAASMLGIFKARAAYLPLDGRLPIKRLEAMLRGAGCQVVLGLGGTGLENFGDPVVAVIDVASIPEMREGVALPLFAPETVDDLAYVLFTSGSTGAPKGAMILQGGLQNHLKSKIDLFAIDASDRIAQTSSAASDMSLWQLLCPLIVGGQAWIFDDKALREPGLFVAAMAEAGVTLFDAVPSFLRLLIEQTTISAASLPTLRCLVLGGETLSPELCRAWFARFPKVPIVNCYGPTECSDGVTHEWITTPPKKDVLRIPIGRPIDNLEAYIVEPMAANLIECAPGAVGELVVGGVGVGIGYVQDPERTKRAFLPNPFSSDPALARLYRTGDLARALPDGRLEYYGRKDRQVKIRGHRVELGEIEARLLGHDAIAECAVVLRSEDRQTLVAYVRVLASLTVEEMSVYLGDTLPMHMIPDRFVILDSVPFNANGKVDYSALPDPGHLRPALGTPYVPPALGLEAEIASAWACVLGLDRVGARDGFSFLGGDSLSAISAITHIEAQTGVRVTFEQIFDLAVFELASVVAGKRAGDPIGAACTSRLIEKRLPEGQYPLTPSQERYWARVQRDPFYNTDHLHSTLLLRGPLDVAVLSRGLSEIVRRHASLRTTFHCGPDGRSFQLVHEDIRFELALRTLPGLDGGERERWIREEVARHAAEVFDFSRGPLIRATLLELDDELHVLALAMHHIVSDGWSWGVLTRELGALYNAFVQGRPSPLPELDIQYMDYALWIRDWRASAAAAEELAYWARRLRGAPSRLDLPTDRPRPSAQSFAAGVVHRHLCCAWAREFDSWTRTARATPFMGFAAAFGLLLGRLTGRQDVLFGSVIANRTEAEIASLIGCFQNGLLVRVDLSEYANLPDLLERVRRTTLEDYDHQRVSHESIVEHVFPGAAVPQVVFALQEAPDEDHLRLAKIDVEGMACGFSKIKYDFVLEVFPRKDGYAAVWSYSEDLFDEATIVRWANEFEGILRTAVAARA